jgi:hypothetical protein
MEMVVSALLGLGLAAACGFRVFVPLLVAALAARAELLTVQGDLEWVSSGPALAALFLATVLEIGAYYIPWVDNLLDTAATPAAIVAGVLVSASVMTDVDPVLQWGLAAIAGGGAAGMVQVSTTLIRALSTVTTGGLGNGAVSSAEAGGAVTLSVVAVLAPAVACVVVAILAVATVRLIRGRRRRRRSRTRSIPT